jgi:hypothetical protein
MKYGAGAWISPEATHRKGIVGSFYKARGTGAPIYVRLAI